MVLGVLVPVWLSTLPGLDVSEDARLPRLPSLRPAPALRPIAGLQTAALDRSVAAFEPGRNLFTFASSPSSEDRPGEQDPRRQGTGTVVEEQAPRAPALDLAFLGVFGPERLRVAVFESKDGEDVVNILERDLLEERYRVLEIAPDAILLRDTASPGEPPIRVELP